MRHTHLPNLNSLRFLAASIVVFTHVDDFLASNNYIDKKHAFFPFSHSSIAVVFFFTLSGFLITHLLLQEKAFTSTIQIKPFYLKRILRIWPLYFLVLAISFFYFNTNPFFAWKSVTDQIDLAGNYWANIGLLLLISPNIVLLNSPSLGYANPLWSIGVEEQFYLLWPWLIRKKDSIQYVIIAIALVYLLQNGLIQSLINPLLSKGVLTQNSSAFTLLFKVNRFFQFGYSFRIDAMGIGALGAYLASNPQKIPSFLFAKRFQYFIYAALVVMLLFLPNLTYQFYALIFTLILFNLAFNTKSIVSLEHPILSYLGQISFGIYMFHCLTIAPSVKLITLFVPVSFAAELVICFTSLLLTILIAYLSFNTYEAFFLRFRPKQTASSKELQSALSS